MIDNSSNTAGMYEEVIAKITAQNLMFWKRIYSDILRHNESSG